MLSKSLICTENNEHAWEMHKTYFDNQRNLRSKESANKLVNDMVAKYKMNKKTFNACMESEETKNTLLKQIDQAVKNRVTGTPAIFVNGRKLNRGQFPQVLEAVHEQL